MAAAGSPATQTASNPLVLSLSGEELYVLMRVLKVRVLPGVDLAWLDQSQDGSLPATNRSALASATNALVARGFIEVQADQSAPDVPPDALTLRLPAAVIATIGTCAFGDCTIQLTLARPSGLTQLFFHEFRRLGVVHSVPQSDIHEFTVLDGRAGMMTCISSVMALDGQAPVDLLAGRIAATQMRTVRELALLGQTEAAVTMLTASGLPAATSAAFVHAIAEARSIGTCAIAARWDDDAVHRCEFAFVVAPTICFMVSAVAAEPGLLAVQSVSANEMRTRIGSQLPRIA